MIDKNKHKIRLADLLKDIYADVELASCLGFKGGTALMFFYDLPRFSVDLDFNLIQKEREDSVYKKVRSILLDYGTIHDEAKKYYGKYYGLLIVLNYGKGERKLKVGISNRTVDDHYEVKNLFGINMNVMVISDMFAHKLCALLDRDQIINRDIFDCWFFMNRRTAVNETIIEERMEMTIEDYLGECIDQLKRVNDKGLLQGLGELMEEDMKVFVRNELLDETLRLCKLYQKYPLIA